MPSELEGQLEQRKAWRNLMLCEKLTYPMKSAGMWKAIPLGITVAADVVANGVAWDEDAWLVGTTTGGWTTVVFGWTTVVFGLLESMVPLDVLLERATACGMMEIGLEVVAKWDTEDSGFWVTICLAGKTSGTLIFAGVEIGKASGTLIFAGAEIGESGLRTTLGGLEVDALLAKSISSWACISWNTISKCTWWQNCPNLFFWR
jgi:hypothetical protein